MSDPKTPPLPAGPWAPALPPPWSDGRFRRADDAGHDEGQLADRQIILRSLNEPSEQVPPSIRLELQMLQVRRLVVLVSVDSVQRALFVAEKGPDIVADVALHASPDKHAKASELQRWSAYLLALVAANLPAMASELARPIAAMMRGIPTGAYVQTACCSGLASIAATGDAERSEVLLLDGHKLVTEAMQRWAGVAGEAAMGGGGQASGAGAGEDASPSASRGGLRGTSVGGGAGKQGSSAGADAAHGEGGARGPAAAGVQQRGSTAAAQAGHPLASDFHTTPHVTGDPSPGIRAGAPSPDSKVWASPTCGAPSSDPRAETSSVEVAPAILGPPGTADILSGMEGMLNGSEDILGPPAVTGTESILKLQRMSIWALGCFAEGVRGRQQVMKDGGHRCIIQALNASIHTGKGGMPAAVNVNGNGVNGNGAGVNVNSAVPGDKSGQPSGSARSAAGGARAGEGWVVVEPSGRDGDTGGEGQPQPDDTRGGGGLEARLGPLRSELAQLGGWALALLATWRSDELRDANVMKLVTAGAMPALLLSADAMPLDQPVQIRSLAALALLGPFLTFTRPEGSTPQPRALPPLPQLPPLPPWASPLADAARASAAAAARAWSVCAGGNSQAGAGLTQIVGGIWGGGDQSGAHPTDIAGGAGLGSLISGTPSLAISVSRAMTDNISSLEIVRLGCFALAAVMDRNASVGANWTRREQSRVAEAVVGGMNQHANDFDLQIRACWCLGVQAEGGPTARIAGVRAQAVSAIQNALRRFDPTDPDAVLIPIEEVEEGVEEGVKEVLPEEVEVVVDPDEAGEESSEVLVLDWAGEGNKPFIFNRGADGGDGGGCATGAYAGGGSAVEDGSGARGRGIADSVLLHVVARGGKGYRSGRGGEAGGAGASAAGRGRSRPAGCGYTPSAQSWGGAAQGAPFKPAYGSMGECSPGSGPKPKLATSPSSAVHAPAAQPRRFSSQPSHPSSRAWAFGLHNKREPSAAEAAEYERLRRVAMWALHELQLPTAFKATWRCLEAAHKCKQRILMPP